MDLSCNFRGRKKLVPPGFGPTSTIQHEAIQKKAQTDMVPGWTQRLMNLQV